ncbi:hypothetical protein BC351_29125 [Paenibacillus ferrarius]|uniref:Uncharacterized protein n=1 Tax=Paenibacillus ferrarius TaxID=1469647 RepID=A0A1V4HHZ3_9BACL|nr:hypothetical protein BC351_29125 [Paenibacillus ferrarius]
MIMQVLLSISEYIAFYVFTYRNIIPNNKPIWYILSFLRSKKCIKKEKGKIQKRQFLYRAVLRRKTFKNGGGGGDLAGYALKKNFLPRLRRKSN